MAKVLLVGAGHMGQALLRSWIKFNIKGVSVIDPKVGVNNNKIFNLKLYRSSKEIKNIKNFDIIFFAVKPQIINKVIKDYKMIPFKNKLIISIVAGKEINFFEKHFGKKTSIIRTMPNLPASVAGGVTCLFSNKNVTLKQKNFTNNLFKAVGKTFWVKNESYINKFTAISGSGPAYFYFFIESLSKAGVKIGLNKKESYEIAKQTAIGSISLMKSSKDSAEKLRKKIAIKGGTTEAAIKSFQKNKNMEKSVYSGVKAAFKRAIKLGS